MHDTIARNPVRIIAVLRLLSQVTMQTLSGGRQPTCAAIRDDRPVFPELVEPGLE